MSDTSRRTLHLPVPQETATVREAKELARELGNEADPETTAFALKLIEERDGWINTKRARR